MHASTVRVTPRVRILALGGVIGPVSFLVAWMISGLASPGYSPVRRAISDLAAFGSSTRVTMSTGFVVFGAGLIAFGLALREALGGRAWIAAVVTGASTLGVAATPLGGWSGEGVHATFAGLGYASIVILPLLAAPRLARAGRRGRARASAVIGLVAAVSLFASTLGPAHGLWQRLGLTVADVWIVVTAAEIAAGVGPAPTVRLP